jgi:hypothetical protein
MAQNKKRWTAGIVAAGQLIVLFVNQVPRGWIVVICCAVWGCLVFASSYFAQDVNPTGKRVLRWILIIFFWATIVFLIGYWRWPDVLVVTPGKVVFIQLPPSNQMQYYSFTLSNKSDKDVYIAEMDLTLKGTKNISTTDPAPSDPDLHFYLNPHPAIGESAALDVLGVLCRDREGNPLYIFSAQHLPPAESRTIEVTYSGPPGVEIDADTGFYSSKPLPLFSGENKAGRAFKMTHSKADAGCRPLFPNQHPE